MNSYEKIYNLVTEMKLTVRKKPSSTRTTAAAMFKYQAKKRRVDATNKAALQQKHKDFAGAVEAGVAGMENSENWRPGPKYTYKDI